MEEVFRENLKRLNLKATPKRLAILAIIAGEAGYLSPEEVWERMRNRFDRIGLPTVYRNLEDLAGGGVIMKIVHPDRKLYYYYCGNNIHHHHFVCTGCRKVEDLTFCGAEQIKEEVERALHGRVSDHLLQVHGLCRDCVKEGADDGR